MCQGQARPQTLLVKKLETESVQTSEPCQCSSGENILLPVYLDAAQREWRDVHVRRAARDRLSEKNDRLQLTERTLTALSFPFHLQVQLFNGVCESTLGPELG